MHSTWQAQKINTCTTIFPKFDLTLAELHLKVALDPVVGIVVGVGVHWAVLKPVPIYSAWSKTYIWTPRSTLYNVRESSYSSQGPGPP